MVEAVVLHFSALVTLPLCSSEHHHTYFPPVLFFLKLDKKTEKQKDNYKMGCGASTAAQATAPGAGAPMMAGDHKSAPPASAGAIAAAASKQFLQNKNKCSAYNACAQAHQYAASKINKP